jgi:outer membrane protein assembly factor BamD (BamD/ComL family)
MAVSNVATAERAGQQATRGEARRFADLAADPRSRNLVLGGVGLLLVIVAGAWFWNAAAKRKEAFAARALQQARTVAESGNLPQAAAELQKITETYAGTRSSVEALLVLNQVRMVNGQTELAVVGLREFLAKNPPVQFQAPALGLLGVALENTRKPAEAADAYRKASEAAQVDYLKSEYLLQEGRAYVAAGKPDLAAAAYLRIVKDYPETISLTEAKVRLAELTASR